MTKPPNFQLLTFRHHKCAPIIVQVIFDRLVKKIDNIKKK